MNNDFRLFCLIFHNHDSFINIFLHIWQKNELITHRQVQIIEVKFFSYFIRAQVQSEENA